jgi:hypothetical protein
VAYDADLRYGVADIASRAVRSFVTCDAPFVAEFADEVSSRVAFMFERVEHLAYEYEVELVRYRRTESSPTCHGFALDDFA